MLIIDLISSNIISAFVLMICSILEATAEILTKNLVVFWSIWRHQKDISKLTDLYCALASPSSQAEMTASEVSIFLLLGWQTLPTTFAVVWAIF